MNIVIVAHKLSELNIYPDDDLVTYLNDHKTANVLNIYHSFNDAKDRKSFCIWYKSGEVYKKNESRDFIGYPEPLIYAKEMFYTIKWVLGTGLKIDMYIGMDGLCIIFGHFLKFLMRVKKTIYWVIDFVPNQRFSSNVKNSIYKAVNKFSYKNSDEVWDLSARMTEARKKFWGLNETDYKKRLVVPYGVWTQKIKKYFYEGCEKNTLVFMGHLIEKQGVQVVIKAIPDIIKVIPNFRFKIIGDGGYRGNLETLAEELKVTKYCNFLGRISDERLQDEIAKSCVAIAPYVKELDTWTYYADPGKIKEYLASGLPVLLTDLPWNAHEIEEKQCGEIIDISSDRWVSQLIKLMECNKNTLYRKNSTEYSNSFDYETIFKKLEIIK